MSKQSKVNLVAGKVVSPIVSGRSESLSGTTFTLSPSVGTSLITTTGSATGTLAAGVGDNQEKHVIMVVNGGNLVLTVATMANGSSKTLTFSAVGQYARLKWVRATQQWYLIGNSAALA